MAKQNQNNMSSNEISLIEFFNGINKSISYLKTQWRIIFIAIFFGIAGGYLYAKSKKTIYKAEYSFVLEDEKSSGMGGALSLASQFGIDMGGSGGGVFSGDNLLELMSSRSIVQKALLSPIIINGKPMSLAEYYIQFNNLRKFWANDSSLNHIRFPIHAKSNEFSRIQDSVFMGIYDNLVKNFLSVGKEDKKLSIIKVEVKSIDETFAKYFTEALVDEISRFYIETKTLRSSRNVAVLQHQVDSIRNRLNSAISYVAQSNDLNPNINTARQSLMIPSQQRQVDVQSNVVILTELVKNLEIAKISLLHETPLIQAIDKPIFPLQTERLGALKGMVIGGFLSAGLLVMILLFKLIKRQLSN